MTNEQRLIALAKIGAESARDAFGGDMPEAYSVWLFLRDNAREVVYAPALSVWMQNYSYDAMPAAFERAYDAAVTA